MTLHRTRRALLAVVLFGCSRREASPTSAVTGTVSSAPAITRADLEQRVHLLAADSIGGRPSGSPGHERTVEYVAAEMQRLGLQPAGNNGTYFQRLPNFSAGSNVVAVLPGSDPTLRGQYVLLGAHSDHLAMTWPAVDHDSLHLVLAAARRVRVTENRSSLNAAEVAEVLRVLDSVRRIRPPRRDSVRNGADDNASGTTALVEIAEAMATAAVRPRRSMLFIWHAAEESGLIGSAHFADHPTVARDSIVAALNVDMISRGMAGDERDGGADYLALIGWRRLSNDLGNVIEQVNSARARPFRFDLTYDQPGHFEQYYCRSDHWSYARYNIPVAFFTTGNHGDYHRVTDEVQYMDFTKLLDVTHLVHDVALRLANDPARPVIDGPRVASPTAQCRQ